MFPWGEISNKKCNNSLNSRVQIRVFNLRSKLIASHYNSEPFLCTSTQASCYHHLGFSTRAKIKIRTKSSSNTSAQLTSQSNSDSNHKKKSIRQSVHNLPDGVISGGRGPIFIIVLVHSTVEVSVVGRVEVCH